MSEITDPIPFRLLIDEAVKWSRSHFRALWLPVAIPMAVANGLLPIIQALWLNTSLYSGVPDPAQMAVGMAAVLVASLAVALVWGLGYGALMVGALDALSGRPVSMSRAWATMVRPRVFGTCLLAALSVTVGCMLCALPGVFLALLFSLILPAMVVEGRFGIDAFARSAQLARFNPRGGIGASPLLKIFLIFFLGYLLSAAVGFMVQMPFVAVQQVMIFRSAAEGNTDLSHVMSTATWLQVPGNMLNALVTTAVQIYMAFALGLFYFDLRRRQEGGDLAAAIQEMRGPEAASPPPPAVE
jgi:hypothetical protein